MKFRIYFKFQIQVQDVPYNKNHCESTAPLVTRAGNDQKLRVPASRYHAHRWNVDDLMAAALPHHAPRMGSAKAHREWVTLKPDERPKNWEKIWEDER